MAIRRKLALGALIPADQRVRPETAGPITRSARSPTPIRGAAVTDLPERGRIEGRRVYSPGLLDAITVTGISRYSLANSRFKLSTLGRSLNTMYG